MMFIQPFEVARIADKYAVILGKEILELGGCGAFYSAEKDMGVARIDGYSVNSRQFSCHSFTLCHKGWEVEGIVISMSEEIMGSLYCKLVYRPWHPAFPYSGKERGRTCDIADTKSRNGKFLCHGVKENDI